MADSDVQSVATSGGVDLVKVTVSGHPGSGTSTLVKQLCRNNEWTYLNGGDVFRTVAKERGISLEEFSITCENEPEVDRTLDSKLISSMTNPSGPEIVESRLSGWWAFREEIPCLRVWLEVSVDERAKRVVNREGGSLKDATTRILDRMVSDQIRYDRLYQIDLGDMTPYNCIIESDNLSPDEITLIVTKQLLSLEGNE
ncbi:MAG: AAA family ATPase [Euryarchaeota archaeon]|nr:AAA family ATPase [Euryarchaeota archaeon]